MRMSHQQRNQQQPAQLLPPPADSIPPPSMAADLSETQPSMMMPLQHQWKKQKKQHQQQAAQQLPPPSESLLRPSMAADLNDLERQCINDLEATGFDANRTFWVGDLRPWMDADYFENLCNHIGEEVSVQVFGKYAFIEFDSTEGANLFLWWFEGTPMLNSSQIFHLKCGTSLYGVGCSKYEVMDFTGKITPPSVYSTLLNIVFVRINEVKIAKSDGFNVWGSVDVGHYRTSPFKVYYRRKQEKSETYFPGDNLVLTGPVSSVFGDADFSIYVSLNVDDYLIAEDLIHWSPEDCQDSEMRDKILESDVKGEFGNVTVCYSIVSKAYRAIVEVLLMIVDGEYVYGTIHAKQYNPEPQTFVALFDKLDYEKVQVFGQAIPLTRSVVVMPCHGLSIVVNLSNGLDCKIVDSEVFFEAVPGFQGKSIGSEVKVNIIPY